MNTTQKQLNNRSKPTRNKTNKTKKNVEILYIYKRKMGGDGTTIQTKQNKPHKMVQQKKEHIAQ